MSDVPDEPINPVQPVPLAVPVPEPPAPAFDPPPEPEPKLQPDALPIEPEIAVQPPPLPPQDQSAPKEPEPEPQPLPTHTPGAIHTTLEKIGAERVKLLMSMGMLVHHLIVPAMGWLAEIEGKKPDGKDGGSDAAAKG